MPAQIPAALAREITILVPTRNRQAYLQNILDTYAGTGLNLIVADTSPQPLDAAASHPNVRYHHARECRFVDKLRFLIDSAPTDIIMLRAENRHITVEGIRRCLERLLACPDCSLVHGAHVWVRRKRGRMEAWPCYDGDNLAGLMHERPEERLLAAFDPMVSLYYAVERRQNIKDVLARAEGIENLNAFEVLLTAIKAVNGKCARERVLFCAVQERPSALKGARNLYDGFDAVASRPEYAGQYARVEEGIAGHLAARTGMDPVRALEVTRESLGRFLRRLAERPRETGMERLARKTRRFAASALRLAGMPDLAARRRLNAYLDSLDGDARAEFAALAATIRRGYAEGW
jgi:glycosyltransferase domain-containing protein